MSGDAINIGRTLGIAADTRDEEVFDWKKSDRWHTYDADTDKWLLNGTGRYYVKQEIGDNVNTAFIVLCVAAAGQAQFRMEKAYNDYKAKADDYQEVNRMSKLAADGQQEAADKDGTSKMDDALVRYCHREDIGYSTAGDDLRHDKDEWQSLRDGLDYQKSIASTDMKMEASKFDQATKDCDSAQQMAVDGVKKFSDVVGKLADMR